MTKNWFIYTGNGAFTSPENYSMTNEKPSCSKHPICAIQADVQTIKGIPRPVISKELKETLIWLEICL